VVRRGNLVRDAIRPPSCGGPPWTHFSLAEDAYAVQLYPSNEFVALAVVECKKRGTRVRTDKFEFTLLSMWFVDWTCRVSVEGEHCRRPRRDEYLGRVDGIRSK